MQKQPELQKIFRTLLKSCDEGRCTKLAGIPKTNYESRKSICNRCHIIFKIDLRDIAVASVERMRYMKKIQEELREENNGLQQRLSEVYALLNGVQRDLEAMEDHVEELKKFKGEGRITTLTPEMIRTIKERYRDGATVYRISKELDIRKDTCRKVIYNTFAGERSREKVDAVKVEGFISPQEKTNNVPESQ